MISSGVVRPMWGGLAALRAEAANEKSGGVCTPPLFGFHLARFAPADAATSASQIPACSA
jgi:hypothetical protein